MFRTSCYALAGIIGYSDTLLDGALEDLKNNRNFVEIIRTNAVRLSDIAADLLILPSLNRALTPVNRTSFRFAVCSNPPWPPSIGGAVRAT